MFSDKNYIRNGLVLAGAGAMLITGGQLAGIATLGVAAIATGVKIAIF